MNTNTRQVAVISNTGNGKKSRGVHLPYQEMSDAFQTIPEIRQSLDQFSAHLQPLVPHSGYSFQNHALNLELTAGKTGRHSYTYNLMFENESIGEWGLTRSERFSELELNLIEDFLCQFFQMLGYALQHRQQLQPADIAGPEQTRDLGIPSDTIRHDQNPSPLGEFLITDITPQSAFRVYSELEALAWAPWLRYSPQEISLQASVFPEGQLLVTDDNDQFLASLSMNRVNWDGDIHKLTTWDEIAGVRRDYLGTYASEGNTLVLMSMSVSPSHQGKKIPGLIIDHVREKFGKLGIEHIISPFRPSGYGLAKSLIGYDLDFKRYCEMRKPGTDQPYDPWLRSLWWKRMRLLKIADQAMVRTVPLQEFYQYHQSYNFGLWEEIEEDVWECGEVGRWYVDKSTSSASYRENNVWGEIPLNDHLL
jgi:GNAT superfamily N-acetyltransferase